MPRNHLRFSCPQMYSSIKMFEKYRDVISVGARRNVSGASSLGRRESKEIDLMDQWVGLL
jgi:hypothetical protein